MNNRVMILEDDPFIALDLQDIVEAAGFEVVGPVASRAEAMRLLDSEAAPGCALLDFNVRGGTSEIVARRLSEMGVPFILITANADSVRQAMPVIQPTVRAKPVPQERIVSDVEMMLA